MLNNLKSKLPLAIDLFSGCGGLTEGLKRAGFNVIGAVEIDSLASETYLSNHPEVLMFRRDIREVASAEILKTLKIKKGQLDLLAGCPPCQGFSSMRTRNGKKRNYDKRNDLVFEYLRLVAEIMPKTVMMENVPALANDRRMKMITAKLVSLGYDNNETPLILNTADYGVPQRRYRMILLSSRVGKIHLPEKDKIRKTVKDAIGHLSKPGKSGDPLHDLIEKRTPRIEKLISLIPKNGGSRKELPTSFQLPCHRRLNGKGDGFKDVYGRMKWTDVSPTITGGCISPSKGRFLHPSQNRSITLREAALLQTFPEKYNFSLSKGRQGVALMIGNALPPLFIRKHAEAIRRLLFR